MATCGSAKLPEAPWTRSTVPALLALRRRLDDMDAAAADIDEMAERRIEALQALRIEISRGPERDSEGGEPEEDGDHAG